MVMRTKYSIKCRKCGHTGAIKMSENDQPYSTQYESYSPENLTAEPFLVEGRFVDMSEVFEHMKPTCPECDAKLTLDDLVS